MGDNSNEGTPLTSSQDVYYGNGGNETMLTDKHNGNVDDIDREEKKSHNGSNTSTPKTEKKGVKLNARNAQQLEIQFQINLIKHSLAADYFEFHQFYLFTLPQAILTAASSVIAFSSSSASFSQWQDILSIVVGLNSAIVVLLQTISGIQNFGMRADRHRGVAIQLRDLRDDIVLMKFKLNSVELDTKQKHEILYKKDGAFPIVDWNKSKEHEEHEHDDDADAGESETFDSIQKRYQQCLSGCTSNVPIELSEAFHGLGSNLEIAETKENVERMHNIYGHLNYQSLVTGKAYDILAGLILNRWNFPLFFPDSKEVVRTTMKMLKARLIESQDLYNDLESKPEIRRSRISSMLTIFSGDDSIVYQ